MEWLKWVADNKEWVFSGIGVTAISVIVAALAKKKKTEPNPIVNSSITNQSVGDSLIIKDSPNASINLNQPDKKKRPKYIGGIPVKSEVFLGREQDLQKIHARLFNDNVLILVNGIGGIGKTTVASHYYHKYADVPLLPTLPLHLLCNFLPMPLLKREQKKQLQN